MTETGRDAGQPSGMDQPGPDSQEQRRLNLLNFVTEVILNNDIDPEPRNIIAIHKALSGSQDSLNHQIEAIKDTSAKIADTWTEEKSESGLPNTARKQELDYLMTKLESGINVFADLAKAAQHATGSYHDALEQHVCEINAANSTNHLVTSLADIAKTMMERTRQVEEQMQRSAAEAVSLRASLARAQQEAGLDHLTGLPNRRAFEGVLEAQYRQAQQEIEPLTIALCDIDHFKLVNDTHGHDAGDRVLQAVAQSFARISNENCHIARQGGEEFIMVFRGMTTREATRRLDDVRERMASRKFFNRINDDPIGQVTFSAGVANVFAYAHHRQALEAADAALYRAKNQGRNRIVIAES